MSEADAENFAWGIQVKKRAKIRNRHNQAPQLTQLAKTILMKYHTLFVIFEKAAKFNVVVCCKL